MFRIQLHVVSWMGESLCFGHSIMHYRYRFKKNRLSLSLLDGILFCLVVNTYHILYITLKKIVLVNSSMRGDIHVCENISLSTGLYTKIYTCASKCMAGNYSHDIYMHVYIFQLLYIYNFSSCWATYEHKRKC